MRNGGYILLDLSKVTFAGSGGSYTGTIADKTFKAIKNTAKPVLVSGLKLGNTSYGDSLATYTVRDNPNSIGIAYLMASGYFIAITISATGAITVEVND